MANYCGLTRTNYFRVRDVDKFKDIIRRIQCHEGESLTIMEETINNVPHYGFYVEGVINGLIPTDDDAYIPEDEYDEPEADRDYMLRELSKVIDPEDAILIMEIGNEKMRYLIGYADVITAKGCTAVNLSMEAIVKARKILGNPSWITRTDY